MTILSVAQSVATRVGAESTSSLFGNSSPTYVEMRETISDCAAQIVDGYDWSALRKTATLTGDGVETEFPLTSITDFRRLVRDANLYSANGLNYPYGYFRYITDTQQWLAMETNAYGITGGGVWAIFGGAIHIRDGNDGGYPLGNGTEVKFIYVSNNIVRAVDNSTKPEFTMDNDTFILDERLLKLSVIWNWKQQHGQSYAAEMDEYELALQRARMADNNPQSIRMGSGTYSFAPVRF